MRTSTSVGGLHRYEVGSPAMAVVLILKGSPHLPACCNGDRRIPSQWLENDLELEIFLGHLRKAAQLFPELALI
jgi:hypothetical protein